MVQLEIIEPGEIGAYSDRIEIQIKSTKTDRKSDKQKQIYTFEVEAVYTDDAGERHPVTIANYQAQLQKMVARKIYCSRYTERKLWTEIERNYKRSNHWKRHSALYK